MKQFNSIQDYISAIGINDHTNVDEIFIYRIEDYLGNEQIEMKPYRHDFFEITYGYGHDVEISVGDKSFNPTDGLLSFTTPHNISSWKIKGFRDDSLGIMILFKPSFLNNTYHTIDLYRKFQFFNINSTPAISAPKEESEDIVNLMKAMLNEFDSVLTESKKNILAAYLTIVLEKTNSLFRSPASKLIFSNRSEEIAFRFETLLKEKVSYQLRLSDYASELNISANYLSEAVKKATGKSAKQTAQEFLTLYAKSQLLLNTNTIAVIADNLGFYDPSNFVKYFKKRTGKTPTQFRKENR
ncbi:MAG: helix-turn-helix domain-containing protein [Balneola sp.]